MRESDKRLRGSGGALAPRLLRAGAGVLTGLVAMNLLVALTTAYSPSIRVDPDLGAVREAGLFVVGTEGYCVTRLNSMGFRAPEPDAVRGSDMRVLFLGDSLTEAYQVMDDETFVLRVQEGLTGSGRSASCVNAGISGASPAYYLSLAPALKSAYAPTHVVVQVGDTDFGPSLTSSENVRWLEPRDGAWVVKTGATDSGAGLVRSLGPRLPALYYIYQRMWRRAAAGRDGADAGGMQDAAQAAPEAAAPDPRLVAWVLSRLRDEYGPDLVILYLPRFDYFGDTGTPSETESLVGGTCDELGIAFADMREPFRERYAATRQPLHGFANTAPGTGHLNGDGHAAVAAALLPLLGAGSDPGGAGGAGGG